MTLSSKNRLRLLARIFAVASVLVMLSGRFVHIHQVDGVEAVETANQTQQSNSHHAGCSCSHNDADQDGDRDSGHEHHNCAVCSFFAITPVTPDVVDLPQTTDVVDVLVELYSASPRSLAPLVSRLRGPPAPQICG